MRALRPAGVRGQVRTARRGTVLLRRLPLGLRHRARCGPRRVLRAASSERDPDLCAATQPAKVRRARRTRFPRELLPRPRQRCLPQRILRRRGALFSLCLAARASAARRAFSTRGTLRSDAFCLASHLGFSVGPAQLVGELDLQPFGHSVRSPERSTRWAIHRIRHTQRVWPPNSAKATEPCSCVWASRALPRAT